MKRNVQYIITIIEDFLCSLTMMDIPVKNYGFLLSFLHKVVCCYCDIVKKREPVRLVFQSAVMSWGPYETNCIWMRLLFTQSQLYCQNRCFDCLKSSIKSIFHVIRVHIDEHFRLRQSFTPHTLYELVVSSWMKFNYLLLSYFNQLILRNLRLLLHHLFVAPNRGTKISLIEIFDSFSDAFWSLGMIFGTKLMQQIELIV